MALDFHAHAIHERQPQIAHRRAGRIFDVPAGIDRAAAAAGQNRRAIVMVVANPIAVAVSQQDHRIIEQRFVPFLDRLHLLQEVGELLHDVVVDLADFGNFFLVARVVG